MYLKAKCRKRWCKLRLHAKPPWWFILNFSSAFSRDSDRWSLLHVVMLTWSLSPWNNPSGNMRLKALEKFTVVRFKCCTSGGEERFLQRTSERRARADVEPTWVQQEVNFHVNHMVYQFEEGFLHSGCRTVCESGLTAEVLWLTD